MDLRETLAALRAGWWLIVLGLLGGGGVAMALSLLQAPQYTSSTQLFVSTTGSTDVYDAFQGSQLAQQRVTSYARLLTGEAVASRIVDRLDLDLSPADVAGQINAAVVADTVIIDVQVTDSSATRAQQIAEALGAEFPEFVREVETSGSGSSTVRVTVTDAPEVASVPSSPRPLRNVALGAALGMLIGAALGVLRRRLDTTVKDPEEAARLGGAPLLGSVLRDSEIEKKHVIERSTNSRSAEDYRQIRTNLQFLNVDEPPRVIMVTSALPAEGKTTAAVNLALALADTGRRVAVVEADLRRPRVTRYLGMVGGVGLTNILVGSAEMDEVAQEYGERGLSVIAAGPTPPNPGELLASSQMAALVDKLRGQYDYVILDAPPLLPVADSSGLGVHTDGALLSVRYGSTHKDQLRQAATVLERVGVKVLGVILNIVPPKADVASAYGYGYGYDDPKQ